MGIEEVLGQFHKSVEQEGKLVEDYMAAEKARLEAEKAKTAVAPTQIIAQTQTLPSKSYEVRGMWKPLEALVQQGPNSMGGVEAFGPRVFEQISSAVRQIYPDLGGDKWELRDDGGWSNDKLYLCINCNAVQRRDTGERLTTTIEYVLIQEAFKLAHILLNQDTSSCSGVRIESVKGQPLSPPIQTYAKVPQTDDSFKVINNAAVEAGRKRKLEEETLKKSIGGEWYENNNGGWWNSLYLFCSISGKAYLRTTGEEAPKSVDVGKVMQLLSLSQSENLCYTNPLYAQIAPTLPEGAKVYIPNNCSACKALKK